MTNPTKPNEIPRAATGEASGAPAVQKLTTLHRLRPADIGELLKKKGKFNDGGSLYLHVRRPKTNSAEGSAAWVFELRDGEIRKSHGLGSCPPITLAMARKARADIIQNRAALPRRRAADRLAGFAVPSLASTTPNPDHAKTFGEVAKKFLDARTAQYSADQLGRYRSMLELHVPAPLYARPMAAIDAQEIADMLRPIWNGSVDSTGRKLRPLIEIIFNAARITPNPATLASVTSGLVHGLPKSSTAKAKSVASLPYAKVPTLMKELSNDSGDVARLVRFIILTGVRIKEALGAHWSEIDLKARTWTVTAERMKMDVEHVVPLSNAALKLLGPKGEGLIFRGTRFGREVGQNVALRFLKTFGRVDDKGASITIHGFRSSMATWAEERKPPFLTKVIHFNLAHYSKQDKISKAYLRGAHWTERCEMMEAWGAFVTPT